MRLLRHASAHTQNEVRIGFPDFFELTEDSEESLVSIFANAAGIDHNNVRFECILLMCISHCLEQTGDILRIMLIHLAAIGDDVICFHS